MHSRTALWLIAGGLAGVGLILWQVSNVIRIKHLLVECERKQHVLDSLAAIARHEQITIARLESAERIRRLAREQLGMIEAPSPPIPVRIEQP